MDTRTISDEETLNNSGKNYDEFSVENVSLLRKIGDKTCFSLIANKVVHRKRSSRLFYYENIKEIVVSDANISIYECGGLSNKASDSNAMLFDNIKCLATSFGKPPMSVEDYIDTKMADKDLSIMSRVIFENVSINMHWSNNSRMTITATNADLSADLENMIFTGSVEVIDASKRKFSSSKAVWSKKHRGIYFPEGYVSQNKEHRNGTLFSVNRKGEFFNMVTTAIQYIDLVEKNEDEFYSRFIKKIPPPIRIMLGLPLSQE